MEKLVKLGAEKPPPEKVSAMSKLNTTLLSVCTAGILWMAKETNSLDSRVSSLESLMQERTANMSNRITTLENNRSIEGPRVFELGARIDVLESRMKK